MQILIKTLTGRKALKCFRKSETDAAHTKYNSERLVQ